MRKVAVVKYPSYVTQHGTMSVPRYLAQVVFAQAYTTTSTHIYIYIHIVGCASLNRTAREKTQEHIKPQKGFLLITSEIFTNINSTVI